MADGGPISQRGGSPESGKTHWVLRRGWRQGYAEVVSLRVHAEQELGRASLQQDFLSSFMAEQIENRKGSCRRTEISP